MMYFKLVRDRIPEIIEASGKTCITKILDEKEYLKGLDAKLTEEAIEYHASHNIEELADLSEVVRALLIFKNFTISELADLLEAVCTSLVVDNLGALDLAATHVNSIEGPGLSDKTIGAITLNSLDNELNIKLAAYYKNHSVEALIDVFKAIFIVAHALGCAPDNLELIRAKKSEERGAFEKRIQLIEVIS